MIEGFLGDIWRFSPWCWIVIPTNLGFRADGSNVMGAGLAKQAEKLYPGLAWSYGQSCREWAREGGIHGIWTSTAFSRLALFPVKPLNIEKPHLSWKQNASLELIDQSAWKLSRMFGDNHQVAVPLVGCGNGKLDEKDVLPILRKHLTSDRFILVRP